MIFGDSWDLKAGFLDIFYAKFSWISSFDCKKPEHKYAKVFIQGSPLSPEEVTVFSSVSSPTVSPPPRLVEVEVVVTLS